MTPQEIFEQINGTIRLLDNFMFTGGVLDYVELDSSTSQYNDNDLKILEKIGLNPDDYSIRDIVKKVTQQINESGFNLGSYIHRDRGINASYPVGYLVFDYCLAALYGNKTDAALYASHIFYLFGLNKDWNILLQSIILSKLTDDEDIRKFLIVLAASVRPASADSHISSYPKEYAERFSKFEEEAKKWARSVQNG